MSVLGVSLLSTLVTAGVEITKCCPRGQQLQLGENLCTNTTGDLEIWGKFPPKIFSLDAGTFVTETFVVGGTSLPRCGEGETVRRLEREEASDDSFLILYEDRTLFLTSDTTSYPDYCLDQSDVGVVTTALVCRPDPALQCQHSVCVSSCCQDWTVWDPLAEDCVASENSENSTLLPPFSDPASPPSYHLLVGHPQCELQIYSQEEFRLRDDGQLEIEHHHQHHLINTSQYCLLQSGPAQNSSMVAKVCKPASDQQATLDVISRKLTPALLIISEVFLLLTFVLHVIVPEFRKQMFGGCQLDHVRPSQALNISIFYLTTIAKMKKLTLSPGWEPNNALCFPCRLDENVHRGSPVPRLPDGELSYF